MFKYLFVSLLLSSAAACAHDSSHVAETSQTRGAESTASQNRSAKVYLEIMLKVEPSNRTAAAGIYVKYKQPFLDTVPGAVSKQLLVRDEDVVVLHGFDTAQHASEYLKSSLFTNDVVVALKPLLAASPEVRIYAAP
jgi:hypothetical protein